MSATTHPVQAGLVGNVLFLRALYAEIIEADDASMTLLYLLREYVEDLDPDENERIKHLVAILVYRMEDGRKSNVMTEYFEKLCTLLGEHAKQDEAEEIAQ